MPEDTLPVHVNRTELHSLEVPDTFETTDTFDIRLMNHGESVHIHLHLDDALSEVATLDASNHFIDGESERAIRVHVRDGATGRGKLKIASAYGAETRYVDVEVTEPEETEESVTVDESLAQPQQSTEESEAAGVGAFVEKPETIVLALGAVAIFVAVVAAVVIKNTLVTVGALGVLAAVLAAMYVLVAGS